MSGVGGGETEYKEVVKRKEKNRNKGKGNKGRKKGQKRKRNQRKKEKKKENFLPASVSLRLAKTQFIGNKN